MLGDVVNMAARSMGNAPVHGILVGKDTYDSASAIVNFKDGGALDLKGKAKPVQVYQFETLKSGINSTLHLSHRFHRATYLKSWHGWREHHGLEEKLNRFANRSGVLCLFGPGGSAITEMAGEIRSWAVRHAWTVLEGQNMDVTGMFTVPRLLTGDV